MAVYTTQTIIGIREDLQDIVYRLNKQKHPFMTNIEVMSATQPNHEWQKDDVGPPGYNRRPEGWDPTDENIVPTVRLANTNQLSIFSPKVSQTADSSTMAGREKESAYQDLLYALRLANSMESTLCNNQARDQGDPRSSAGFESWVSTNAFHGTTGSTTGFSGGAITAPTDGNARTFQETDGVNGGLKEGIAAAWQAGGDPNLFIMNDVDKQLFSQFDGIATLFKNIPGSEQANIIAGADIYVSDFGQHQVVPSRYVRKVGMDLGDGSGGAGTPSTVGHVMGVDTEFWAVAYLQPIRSEELAKTGHNRKSMVSVEFCLVSKQEAASFKIADTGG